MIDETFAPIAKMTTVQILLAIVGSRHGFVSNRR